MRADSAELLSIDGQPVRVAPWRGSRAIATLAPLGNSASFDVDCVHQLLSVLARRHYAEAITSALPEHEVGAFLAAGFEIKERLWLLAHPLHAIAKPPYGATRRAHRRDHSHVLALDGKAFETFWRLDEGSLHGALHATPRRRFRVIRPHANERSSQLPLVAGYAIFGLAGTSGYLQRLAVDPEYQHRGAASALVKDGLFWLSRRGVTTAFVNTQSTNTAALSLYQHLGFETQPSGLVVLGARFGAVL